MATSKFNVNTSKKSKEKRTLKPEDFISKELPKGLTPFQREQLQKGKKVFATLKRPFEARKDFFPHIIPKVDDLAKSSVRNDIIENLVRLKIRPNVKEASEFLNDFIKFLDTGKRQNSIISYLVKTGQAKTEAEALANLQRFRKRTIKRQGSLEYSRQVDLPFYDPDPARVLPSFVTTQAKRLTEIERFGQENEEINKLINKIRIEGGDADFARKAVDRIMNIINDNSPSVKVSQLLRTWQGFKLGLSAIPNASQGVLNSLLAADLRATFVGVSSIFKKYGKRLGLESGATLDSVIQETIKNVGSNNQFLSKFLKTVGFTVTERFNRIIAANAGADYGKRLFNVLLKNSTNKRARRFLGQMGIDVETALKRGNLDGDDILLIAKKFTNLTQFRSRPQDLPLFASSEAGKVFFQFKNFIYGQTRLVYRETVEELRSGDYSRAVRNTLLLATVFPLTGEIIKDVRSVVTGRKRDTKGLERYFEDIAQVGALGFFADALEAGRFGSGTELLVGPTIGEGGQIIDILGRPNRDKNISKFLLKRIPLLGQILGQRVYPSNIPKKSGIMPTGGNMFDL